MLTLPLVLLAVLGPDEGLYITSDEVPGRTSIVVDAVRFGAKSGDESGSIGGTMRFDGGFTDGDYVVKTLDELIAALAAAQPGQVVFLPGDVVIDCTARVRIEGLVLEIPAGVTLASDRGDEEGSRGALLFSDELATRPLLRVLGDDVRISGLSIRGPDPERRLDHHRRSFQGGRGRDYYYRFPVSDGIECAADRLEVDFCELAGWSHAAIYLKAGTGHHVHHSFLHHNQYQGLGYGICHDVAESLIEFNLFDWNRHSIAGTGRPGSGYEARHNVERGTSLSHCFDMHGGRDRKDGTNVAGTWMKVTNNTFFCRKTAVRIRGVPEQEVRIERNWFIHRTPSEAVVGEERTVLGANAYTTLQPIVRNGR